MPGSGKLAFAFNLNKFNKNSFIAIISSLETGEKTKEIPLHLIIGNDIAKTLHELSFKYEKIIFMWSFFSFNAQKNYESVKKLKKNLPINVIHVAGGPHASGAPVETLRSGFDYVVIGEGEKTIRDFAQYIIEGKSISNIKGIEYLDKAKFIFTGKQNPINLDDYPPFPKKVRMIGPLEITRGCPWDCRYCQTSYMFGRVPRHRSIPEVVKYARKLKANGMKDIRFITPNALSYGSADGRSVNFEAVEKLLKTIKKILGKDSRIFFGSFPSEVRPDQVSQKVLDLIKKYCSNDNLIIGGQSGSQRMLDFVTRGHKVSDIYKAVQLARKNNFAVNVDFIFGLPGETRQARLETLKVMEDLIGMGALIHGHFFMPLVGTPFAKQKPVPLNTSKTKKLKKLESAKKLYGSWESQRPKTKL